MQKNLPEVKNYNQAPSMRNATKSSLETRGNQFINGVVNDLSYELKAKLRYELHRLLDYMFNTSN